MYGAYGRIQPVGNFIDELGSALPSIGGKDVGAECSKWTGEVVKWTNAKPGLFNTASGIAAKLAEAKAEKARTCAAAEVARAQAQEFFDAGLPSSTASTSWLSTVDPTYLLVGGVVIIAGIVYVMRGRR